MFRLSVTEVHHRRPDDHRRRHDRLTTRDPSLLIATQVVTFAVVNSQLPIALHILGFLTSRQGEPLTSEVMAATYGTSPVVLRRVLAKLQQAGLVETRRGVNGGSVLARDPRKINLRQAYEAVTAEPQILSRHPSCEGRVVAVAMAGFINSVMGDAEEALLAELEAVTIAEMDVQIRTSLGLSVKQPLS